MLNTIEPIPSIISLTILFENNVTGKYKTYICMSYVPTRNLHRRFLDIFHLTLLMPDKFSIWLPKSSVPQTRSNQCIRTFKSSNKRGLLAFTSISPAPLIGDHKWYSIVLPLLLKSFTATLRSQIKNTCCYLSLPIY